MFTSRIRRALIPPVVAAGHLASFAVWLLNAATPGAVLPPLRMPRSKRLWALAALGVLVVCVADASYG